MKRLFEVNGQYFGDKVSAKAARGEFKPATTNKPAHYEHTVSKGPDHDSFGVKANRRTHSHNAHSGGAGSGFPKNTRRFR